MQYTNISELFDISGYVHGYEKLWFIGDKFAYNTYQDYFKNLKSEDGTPTTYSYLNYEVRAYLTSQHTLNVKNILSRLRNALITALNEHAVLPKLITIVPDDDIINQVIDDDNQELSFHYERLLSGLCNLFTKTIDCFKDLLPSKAKRENVPHILWIAPPTHYYFSDDNNSRREIFGKSLEVAVNAQKGMSILKMVKFWDHNNTNLFLDESYRYSSEGLKMYWRSVDAAVHFWNVAISKKLDKIKPKKSSVMSRKPATTKLLWKKPGYDNRIKNQRQNSRYKWYNNNYPRDRRERRRQATPP